MNNISDIAIKKANTEKILKGIFIAILDIISLFCAFGIALIARFDFSIKTVENKYLNPFLQIMPVFIICAILIFFLLKLYHSVWSFVSINEMQRIVAAWVVLIVPAMGIQIFWFKMPRSFWFFGFILGFIATSGIRISYRLLRILYTKFFEGKVKENIMIIGAGSAGRMLLRDIKSGTQMRVMCFIDDNPSKKNHYLEGIKIVGGREEIERSVERYNIDKIIFAIPSANASVRKEILEMCKDTGVKTQTVPGIYQLLDGEVKVSKLRDIDLNDLLGREQIYINNKEVHKMIEKKVVMVTGGGGSIGSELCYQIGKESPSFLIIFDIYENNAYEIQQKLRRELPGLNFVTLIGSVRNKSRINDVISCYKPDIIFHAAAHKHVPLMEDSPNEAIKNNVMGTLKTAEAAVKYGVKKFVLISTDKAVNPTNIMGASKKLCEMIIELMDAESDTEFVAVRFGNVLGSNGSVIPLFRKQIQEGGPVTVTDERITRFFMTIPEAVSLVLQAGTFAKGGEIFVLDMGSPVKIVDMARNLIKLSGFIPDEDIKIVFTGLRPGEKLYEVPLMKEEGLSDTINNLIHIGKPLEFDHKEFKKQLKELDEATKCENRDIKQLVEKIVPGYIPEIRPTARQIFEKRNLNDLPIDED